MTDTKYIVDKLFEAGIEISTHLIDSFNMLAEKFGTTASEVFDILVKKEFITGVYCLVVAGILLILVILFLIVLVKSDGETLSVVSFIAAITFFIVALILGYHGAYHVYTPEYAAIEEIVEMIQDVRRVQ